MTTTRFDIHCRACGQSQYEIEIAGDAVVVTCENCGVAETVPCYRRTPNIPEMPADLDAIIHAEKGRCR